MVLNMLKWAVCVKAKVKWFNAGMGWLYKFTKNWNFNISLQTNKVRCTNACKVGGVNLSETSYGIQYTIPVHAVVLQPLAKNKAICSCCNVTKHRQPKVNLSGPHRAVLSSDNALLESSWISQLPCIQILIVWHTDIGVPDYNRYINGAKFYKIRIQWQERKVSICSILLVTFSLIVMLYIVLYQGININPSLHTTQSWTLKFDKIFCFCTCWQLVQINEFHRHHTQHVLFLCSANR